MAMKRTLILFLSLLFIFSCSKESPSNKSLENVSVARDYISDNTEIRADDAIIIARKYCDTNPTKGSSPREIQEVIPIFGNHGVPNMYAVNFEGGKGFLLVSATKKMIPILADVERGSYCDLFEGAVSLLIQEYNETIDYYRAQPKDTLGKIENFWHPYEKEQNSCFHTKSLSSFITSSIAQWESEGYVVYDLASGAPESLPSEVFNDWYETAESVANSNYDFRTNSFILRHRESPIIQTGPFLTTSWNQETPYSNSIPSYGFTTQYLGCAVVALSQILNYFEWPQTYNWSSFPDYLSNSTSGSTPLSDFMYNVGCVLGIDYSSGDYGCSIDVVKLKLQNYYDYTCNLVQHNPTTVFNNIVNNRVVYMRGHSNYNGGSNHAWVCDGTKSHTLTETYELKVISDFEPLEFVSPCLPYEISEGSLLFHMVMGTNDGQYDGWYSDVMPVNLHNYERRDIVNIQPDR